MMNCSRSSSQYPPPTIQLLAHFQVSLNPLAVKGLYLYFLSQLQRQVQLEQQSEHFQRVITFHILIVLFILPRSYSFLIQVYFCDSLHRWHGCLLVQCPDMCGTCYSSYEGWYSELQVYDMARQRHCFSIHFHRQSCFCEEMVSAPRPYMKLQDLEQYSTYYV